MLYDRNDLVAWTLLAPLSCLIISNLAAQQDAGPDALIYHVLNDCKRK